MIEFVGQMAERSDLPLKRLEWIFGWNQMCGDVSKNSIDLNKTIVGVEFTYNKVATEVYQTTSSLSYNQNGLSLLGEIWQLDTTFIIYSLQHLCEMISLNEKTMAFFAAIPGFTYQWARYTDWFLPEWDDCERDEKKKAYKN